MRGTCREWTLLEANYKECFSVVTYLVSVWGELYFCDRLYSKWWWWWCSGCEGNGSNGDCGGGNGDGGFSGSGGVACSHETLPAACTYAYPTYTPTLHLLQKSQDNQFYFIFLTPAAPPPSTNPHPKSAPLSYYLFLICGGVRMWISQEGTEEKKE